MVSNQSTSSAVIRSTLEIYHQLNASSKEVLVHINTFIVLRCVLKFIVVGQSYTPKHIDTPEEVKQKYYAGVLEKQRKICESGKQVECQEPLTKQEMLEGEKKGEPEMVMVSDPTYPTGACNVKSVRFVDPVDRCARDKQDLCEHAKHKEPCNCTMYEKKK